MSVPRLAIVTPVFDDWDAFQRLVVELGDNCAAAGQPVELIVVDDGSNAPFDAARLALPRGGAISAVTILHLALNLGSQRAIAVGLTEAAAEPDLEAVLVMDGDGEDRPADVPRLLARHAAEPAAVILARRSRRSESATFRAGLWVYKRLFSILAGQTVDFGNFSLLPIAAVRRLTHMPELWNNLPAAVMRSRLPYRLEPTERGRRYAGESKMTWVNLVIHGMSALSVYSDVIFVRLLVAAAAIAVIALIAIVTAIVMRLATDLATPGWATTVVGVFALVLMQILLATIVASLALLGGRSRRHFVPKIDCGQFIAWRETVTAGDPSQTEIAR